MRAPDSTRLPYRKEPAQVRPRSVRYGWRAKVAARKPTLWLRKPAGATTRASRPLPTTKPHEIDAATCIRGWSGFLPRSSQNSVTPAETSAPPSTAATIAAIQPGSGNASESVNARISPAAQRAPSFFSA